VRDTENKSNGYEHVAETFMRVRNAKIGVATVYEWSKMLPSGASVLDLGCGHGIPISRELVSGGFSVYGIDASSTMLSEFHRNFPQCPTECESVEKSTFFGRKFDGIIAWGLIFLLTPLAQEQVIRKVAMALNSGGQFLFTAPQKPGTWDDALTGRRSASLGAARYREILQDHSLQLIRERDDEGGNHYYFVMQAR
jgi:2-polyprenyl-3-methyl-5-hydroxy-6-metoxy-1,4-benzoquinol methylase